MAKLAILASGGGSNFEAIVNGLKSSSHEVTALICDRKDAYAFKRAERLGIKSYYVTYYKREREEAERDIDKILTENGIDLIALAGFMRLLTPYLVDRWENKLINIHPALLPKHPGAHGIEESFNSGDLELGVTVHYVDRGMDTGPIIYQKSFTRGSNETLESAEEKIHQIEHEIYPEVLIKKLNLVNRSKN